MPKIDIDVPADLPRISSSLNDLFEVCGLGRPVDPRFSGVFGISATQDDSLIAGLYVAPAGDLWRALLRAGWSEKDASTFSRRIPAIQAIAVRDEFRRQGVGSEIMVRSSFYAERELGAEYMIARLNARNTELHQWYRKRGFNVSSPGEALSVGGVIVPTTADYREAFLPLTKQASILVGFTSSIP